MNRLAAWFLALLLALTGSSLALSGSTAATARLYAQASPSSAVVASLKARTPLDIRSCTGGTKGWCLVSAAGKRGYLPRAQVKASGSCARWGWVICALGKRATTAAGTATGTVWAAT